MIMRERFTKVREISPRENTIYRGGHKTRRACKFEKNIMAVFVSRFRNVIAEDVANVIENKVPEKTKHCNKIWVSTKAITIHIC